MVHAPQDSAGGRAAGSRRLRWSLSLGLLLTVAGALFLLRPGEDDGHGSRAGAGSQGASPRNSSAGPDAEKSSPGPALHGRAFSPLGEDADVVGMGTDPKAPLPGAPEATAPGDDLVEPAGPDVIEGPEPEEEPDPSRPPRTDHRPAFDGLPRTLPAARVGTPARWRDEQPIYTVGFTPDVRRVVSAGEASELVVRDLATGEVLRRLEGHGSGGISDLAVATDGRRVLTGGYDGTARLWDIETGVALRVLPALEDRIGSVEFDASGTRGVLACDDTTVLLWSLDTGEVLEKFSMPSAANCACLSHDGQTLVAGGTSGQLRAWDVDTKKVTWEHQAHEGSLDHVAYLASEDRFVTSGEDGRLRVWGRKDGARVREWQAHDERVSEFALSPDGLAVATGGWEGRVRHARLADGERLWDRAWHSDLIVAIAYSGDGRLVASGSRDGVTQLWDAATGTPVVVAPTTLEGHAGAVTALAFVGSVLVSAGADGTIRTWDVQARAWTRLLRAEGSGALSISFDASGHSFLAGNAERVWLCDLAAGREVWSVEREAQGAPGVALDPGGKRAAWCQGPALLTIHDAASGTPRTRTTAGDGANDSGAWAGLAIAPRESVVALVRPPFFLDLVSLDGLLVRTHTLRERVDHGAPVWFPDGESLLVPSDPGALRVSRQDGRVLARYGLGSDSWAFAVTPDGRGVFLTSEGGDFALCDAADGTPRQRFAAHKQPPTCFAVSPDGRTVASGGPDGAIYVWTLGG